MEGTGMTKDVPTSEPCVEVSATDDIDAVHALGVANGLDESERDEKGLVGAWAARTENGNMVGAIALERSGGLDVVNWMSVDAAYRGRRLASRLLVELEAEARRRGVRRLWATARAPGFFVANGFRPADDGPEATYLIGDCASCPQYGRDCRPQPMVKDLT
jgi:N-acetylglutamate synthase-like GNAT family acetyltransferase